MLLYSGIYEYTAYLTQYKSKYYSNKIFNDEILANLM